MKELHSSEDDVVLCLSETLDDKAVKTLDALGPWYSVPGRV